MDSERVDAAFELTHKRFVDHAVAIEPALPAKRLRHNIHPEMSFPALPLPGVLVGFHPSPRGSRGRKPSSTFPEWNWALAWRPDSGEPDVSVNAANAGSGLF